MGIEGMNIIPLPIGFRFLPPDDEIISFFLKNKMIGDHQTTNCIREVDLLKHEPSQLPAKSVVQSEYPEWFFFYKLNKISQKKNDRSTNDGYWKSTGVDRPVSNGDRVVIGTKKTLVFHKGRTPHGIKTDWVMHEFRASPDFLPPNADHSYVVGYLRNNATEKAENSISNIGLPGTPSAASGSLNNAVGITSMEVNHPIPSYSMDYEMALQLHMEDGGIFDYDLSPSNGLHDLPSTDAIISNDQSMFEEGICLEDLNFLQSDEEQNEWQRQFDTTDIEKQREFMASMFPNQDDRSNVEAEHMLFSGTDLESDNAWCDQIIRMSDGTRGGHSEGLYQQRMETVVRHDEILLMDSGVESETVTSYEINCLESVEEERSVNSRACKSQYEPRPHKSVVQGHPIRVKLQGKSPRKAASGDKTREGGVHGPVTQPAQNKKSILQPNKGPKMDRDQNTKLISNSRSKGSAGSSRNNSFKTVEMSKQRCRPNPPLVCVRNVILGLILLIVVVREVLFIR